MANIDKYLSDIMAAVFGKDVRKSIHDAINEINKAQEVAIDSGTEIHAGDLKTDKYYEKSLYINTDTDQLLRCGSANWQAVGNIRGNGISSIEGPVSSGLADTYTIHYTDGEDTTFIVNNGKGITSFVLLNSVGLVDTYRMTFNDGDTFDMTVKNGNQWYYGTAVSGTSSTTPASFTLPFDVKNGDSYLNVSNDSIYHCVAGAVAGSPSSWLFDIQITSSSTGTNNYNALINHPFINGVEVMGAQSSQDLGLQDELVEGEGIHINGSTHVISADVDLWLMDTTQNPPVPLVKPMPVDSTSVTFSTAEMAQVPNGASVKAYFSTAVNTKAPTFKYMKENTDGSLTIAHSKVKAEQAAGGACACKLRIVK